MKKQLIYTGGLLLASSSVLLATGIEQAYQDPTAAARGNAFTATADKPSAIHYNPAGLVHIEGPSVQGVTLLSRSKVHLDHISGGTQSNSQSAISGSFYAALPGLMDGKLALGLGATIPHGLGIEWDDTSLLRSIGTDASLMHLVISPTVAYKVTDKLSIGASIQYAYDDLSLTQGLLVPGDSFKFEGDGDGWGGSIGLMYRPNDQWSFGATYRSSINTSISGSATTTTIVPMAGTLTENGSTGFDYPQQLVVGAAYKPDDKWTVEMNVQWTDWSSYGDINVDLAISPDISSPSSYKDTVLVGIGASYKYSETVDFNFGYLFSTAAVQDSTYNTLVPDAELHVFSVGVDVKMNNWELSTALLYGHREDRSVSGSPVNPITMLNSDGAWQTKGVSALIGATYTF